MTDSISCINPARWSCANLLASSTWSSGTPHGHGLLSGFMESSLSRSMLAKLRILIGFAGSASNSLSATLSSSMSSIAAMLLLSFMCVIHCSRENSLIGQGIGGCPCEVIVLFRGSEGPWVKYPPRWLLMNSGRGTWRLRFFLPWSRQRRFRTGIITRYTMRVQRWYQESSIFTPRSRSDVIQLTQLDPWCQLQFKVKTHTVSLTGMIDVNSKTGFQKCHILSASIVIPANFWFWPSMETELTCFGSSSWSNVFFWCL